MSANGTVEALQNIVGPIKEQRAVIAAEEARLASELQDVRSTLKEIDNIIFRLSGEKMKKRLGRAPKAVA